LEFPTDYRNSPIVSGEDSRDRLSPKAGVIWNPVGNLFVRGAYTQSLGGVSFDESVSLEPNQVAGFNQVFRSIISESVVGSVAGPIIVRKRPCTKHSSSRSTITPPVSSRGSKATGLGKVTSVTSRTSPGTIFSKSTPMPAIGSGETMATLHSGS